MICVYVTHRRRSLEVTLSRGTFSVVHDDAPAGRFYSGGIGNSPDLLNSLIDVPRVANEHLISLMDCMDRTCTHGMYPYVLFNRTASAVCRRC
jgi:hypothetical protein